MLEGRGCKRGDELASEIELVIGVVVDFRVGTSVLALLDVVVGAAVIAALVGVVVGAAVLALVVGAAVLALVDAVISHTAVVIDPEEP